MPAYELTLILKSLARPALADALKRTFNEVMSQGAVITKVQNLGDKRLPNVMRRHGQTFHTGHYFLVTFEAPTKAPRNIFVRCISNINLLRN